VIDVTTSLQDLPARVAWESSAAESIPRNGGGLMVDRGDFDSRLLALARSRGANVVQPAWPVDFNVGPDAWNLRIESAGCQSVLRARFIIDARGRAGVAGRHSIPLAPPTIALWSHVSRDTMPLEIRVEALDRGWIWGAPLSNRQYRLMAFLDASILKGDQKPEEHLRSCLGDGELFRLAATAEFLSQTSICSTPSFLDTEFAQPGRIKVGENALALDPLSSSGVEKSMRTALQGAITVNTILDDASMTATALDFFRSRVIESAARHAAWNRGYHEQVLRRFDHEFWQKRATYAPDRTQVPGRVADQLFETCERVSSHHSTDSAASVPQQIKELNSSRDLTNQLESTVSLSPALSRVQTPCVIGDRVELRTAILHPSFSEPIAFLSDQEVQPLLHDVATARNLGQLLTIWSSRIPMQKAVLIAAWLYRHDVLRLSPKDQSSDNVATTVRSSEIIHASP
jgi:flavin-dependent dehydrogenase